MDVILENKVGSLKIEVFKKMSIAKSLPLKSYSSMKIFQIIFDIENWLWKSEFCHFWQLLLNWPQDLKPLRGWLLVLGLMERLVDCATVCVKSALKVGKPNTKHCYHAQYKTENM